MYCDAVYIYVCLSLSLFIFTSHSVVVLINAYVIPLIHYTLFDIEVSGIEGSFSISLKVTYLRKWKCKFSVNNVYVHLGTYLGSERFFFYSHLIYIWLRKPIKFTNTVRKTG